MISVHGNAVAKQLLPSLSALRGFEAAARHLSFSRAAVELNLTQSAVSHQIGQLEKLWKLSLFERHSGTVALTAAGRSLAPVIGQFLAQLRATLDALATDGRSGVLRVNVHDSFAVTWLLPRLASFQKRQPKIRVWLSTDEFKGFDSVDVDIAIRLSAEKWKGVYAEPLLNEYLIPVCSPELLRQRGKPKKARDLLSWPLIVRYRVELDGRKNRSPSWDEWFGKHGIRSPVLGDCIVFPHTSMAVQAAIAGQGVALARSTHISDQLERGQLVKLFDVGVPSSTKYWILCRSGRQGEKAIAAFRHWLRGEAASAQKRYDEQANAKGERRSWGEAAATDGGK